MWVFPPPDIGDIYTGHTYDERKPKQPQPIVAFLGRMVGWFGFNLSLDRVPVSSLGYDRECFLDARGAGLVTYYLTGLRVSCRSFGLGLGLTIQTRRHGGIGRGLYTGLS